MLGLLLGFVSRAIDLGREELILEGVAAGGRCIVWFAAYALLERIDWSDRARALVLTVGVTAVLFNLCVSGGLGAPALMGLWLTAAALALNAVRTEPFLSPSWRLVLIGAPLPVLFALTMIYVFNVFNPVVDTVHTLRVTARVGFDAVADQSLPVGQRSLNLVARQPGEDPLMTFLDTHVITPLQKAAKDDPDDARVWLHLARWYGQLWQRAMSDRELSERAIRYALLAQQRDPNGRRGYEMERRLRITYAQRLELPHLPALAAGLGYYSVFKDHDELNLRAPKMNAKAREQYHLAAEALQNYVDKDPTDALLHYTIAHDRFLAQEDAKGLKEAREALKLQSLLPEPRKLSKQQVDQLETWIRTREKP
jgi:hypothetical protein